MGILDMEKENGFSMVIMKEKMPGTQVDPDRIAFAGPKRSFTDRRSLLVTAGPTVSDPLPNPPSP